MTLTAWETGVMRVFRGAAKKGKNARFAHAAPTDDAETVGGYDTPLGYAPLYAVSKRRVCKDT